MGPAVVLILLYVVYVRCTVEPDHYTTGWLAAAAAVATAVVSSSYSYSCKWKKVAGRYPTSRAATHHIQVNTTAAVLPD